MDYYDILGVSKNASDKELKSAFKKKAMQYHPDKGGDPEQFKQINEAYSNLSDPQKRTMYDQFGTTDPNQSNFGNMNGQQFHFRTGPEGFDMNDLMNQFGFGMFGQNPFGNRRPPMKNDDIQCFVDIGLDEAFTGKTLRISYELQSGGVQTHEINIPAGVHDVIRYQGLGNNGIPNVPRGDLYAKIRIKNTSNWKRNGLDIHTVVPVTIFDLLLGTDVNITTPEGKSLSVKIPKGSQPSVVFSIHGYGIPDIKNGKRGIVFVKLNTIVPNIQDPELLERANTLKKDLTND